MLSPSRGNAGRLMPPRRRLATPLACHRRRFAGNRASEMGGRFRPAHFAQRDDSLPCGGRGTVLEATSHGTDGGTSSVATMARARSHGPCPRGAVEGADSPSRQPARPVTLRGVLRLATASRSKLADRTAFPRSGAIAAIENDGVECRQCRNQQDPSPMLQEPIHNFSLLSDQGAEQRAGRGELRYSASPDLPPSHRRSSPPRFAGRVTTTAVPAKVCIPPFKMAPSAARRGHGTLRPTAAPSPVRRPGLVAALPEDSGRRPGGAPAPRQPRRRSGRRSRPVETSHKRGAHRRGGHAPRRCSSSGSPAPPSRLSAESALPLGVWSVAYSVAWLKLSRMTAQEAGSLGE